MPKLFLYANANVKLTDTKKKKKALHVPHDTIFDSVKDSSSFVLLKSKAFSVWSMWGLCRWYGAGKPAIAHEIELDMFPLELQYNIYILR